MGISVTGAISGGNPRNLEAIRYRDGVYHIEPWSEDGDANYKFHLLVEIRNGGARPVDVPLEIEWADIRYASLRDQMYASSGDGWRLLVGAIDGSAVRARVRAAPGSTLVSLHPAYRDADHQRLLQRSVAAGAVHSVEGKSAAGADIDMLRFGDAARSQPIVLVSSRVHPYETAASFCVEGIIDTLTGPRGREILERFQVAVIPMANPDGVEGGLCKRVGPGGPNPEKGLGSGDPTASALQNAVDRLRPASLLELHGWMNRPADGLSVYDRALAGRFVEEFARVDLQKGPRRDWREGDHTSGPDDPTDVRQYARRAHASRVLVLSFGWIDRDVNTMKNLGGASLFALTSALAG